MSDTRHLHPVPPLDGDDDHLDHDHDDGTDAEIVEELEDLDIEIDAEVLDVDWDEGTPKERRKILARPSVGAMGRAAYDRAHALAFHGVRLPTTYWADVARTAHVGAWSDLCAGWRWAFDAEGADDRRLVRASVGKGEAAASIIGQAKKDHRWTLVSHLAMTAAGLFALRELALGTAKSGPAGWVAIAAAAYVAIAIEGLRGRPAGAEPIMGATVRRSGRRPFRNETILDALASLPIDPLSKAIAKDPRSVVFVTPVRDVANIGWEVQVDLPAGITAGQVIAKREQLAASLRWPVACVWPEPAGQEHPGRLVLFVAKTPLAKGPGPEWPLAKSGTHNVFRPLDIGVDQRGRRVATTLILQGAAFGAKPRMGKSAAVRVLSAGAALDPRVELHLYACKGGRDLKALGEKVAHAYASSADMRILAPKLVADLREAMDDLSRRADLMADLDSDACPDGQITDGLANTPGLHPVLWVIDECHAPFTDPVHGREIVSHVDTLARVGPAYGVMVVLATQRPDTHSLPRAISANLGLRWCFRVMTPGDSNMVLGEGYHGMGYRATDFTDTDKGISWFIGDDEPAIMRWTYLDLHAAERIAQRAYDLRKKLGRLTGMAAGEELVDAEPVPTILDDMAQVVWMPGEARLATQVIIERLAEGWPDRYGGWTTEMLTKAVKPYGLTVRTMRVKGYEDPPRALAYDAFHEAHVRQTMGAPGACDTPGNRDTGVTPGVTPISPGRGPWRDTVTPPRDTPESGRNGAPDGGAGGVTP